jgi:microcystin degradation protein MlrC
MRVGLLSIQHESNTFLPGVTSIDDFRRVVLLRGEAVLTYYRGGHHEISGFIESLERQGLTPVPLMAAFAFPGGPVANSALEELLDTAFQELDAAGELDGILVAPHGAAVSEYHHDMDGWWLRKLREKIGEGIPVVGVIDPHANLSSEMAQFTNALIAYRENPHIDQKRRGLEAGDLMGRMLNESITPFMEAAFPPMAMNIEAHSTLSGPLVSINREFERVRALPGVLSASLVMGYPYADVPDMGSAVIVVTDGEADLCARVAKELTSLLWEQRAEFRGNLISVSDAVAQASRAAGPVALLDMGDNMGGGAPADSTVLLRATQELASGLRAFVCLYDPASVELAEQAGTGARLSMQLGGKTSASPAPPFACEAKVLSIFEGRYREAEPRHGGWTEFDMGRTAIVELENGSIVMLTSQPAFPASAQQMLAFGLDPKSFDLIILKGVHSPVTAYQDVCPTMIRVNTPGVTTADMESLPYLKRRRPLYPFES